MTERGREGFVRRPLDDLIGDALDHDSAALGRWTRECLLSLIASMLGETRKELKVAAAGEQVDAVRALSDRARKFTLAMLELGDAPAEAERGARLAEITASFQRSTNEETIWFERVKLSRSRRGDAQE